MKMIIIVTLLLLATLLSAGVIPAILLNQTWLNGIDRYSGDEKTYAKHIVSISQPKTEFLGVSIVTLETVGDNPQECIADKKSLYNISKIYKAKIQYHTWFGIPAQQEVLTSYSCE